VTRYKRKKNLRKRGETGVWGKPKDVGRKVRKAKGVYRSETSSLFRTSVVLRGSGPVIVVLQFSRL